MSTDAQDLSPEMQAKAIAAYAQANNLTVSATYLDAGRSGLTLHKRPAMKKLLADVAREDCGFSTILVYDISRWGRFQDTDASAYYEYQCRLQGVAVTYVQELATCTDSPIGSLIKGLKRAMAAEFGRELAIKTRAGQNSAIDRGLHMGSLPCIGISRVAVSKGGAVERALGPFEHKAFAREHVKWVRGPDEEWKLVQEIFNRYAYTDITFEGLAHQLQIGGRVARSGRPITTWMLHSLIDCEAFVGTSFAAVGPKVGVVLNRRNTSVGSLQFWNPRHHVAAIERHVEEELQPGQRRIDRDRRSACVDQVQLEAA
jgi:DNA invertase Pin-like site-specific DNA recombinase